MAERERAVAFTIPWNCEAGPAKSEELMRGSSSKGQS
jgi:hypothetical protein